MSYIPPGVAALNAVRLNASAQLPAVSGALLTGISASAGAQGINDQTGGSDYTLVLADAQKNVLVNSAAIVTIPPNASVAFPVGTWVEVNCANPTVTTSCVVEAGAGVTLRWSAGNNTAPYAWGNQTIKLRQVAANLWVTTIYPVIPGAASGVLRPDGNGWVEAAVAAVDYVAPGGAGTVVVDTGWTANADGGDKTAVIPSNATIDGMQTALNLVSAGLGDLIVALSDKVKALETVLVASKIPNA